MKTPHSWRRSPASAASAPGPSPGTTAAAPGAPSPARAAGRRAPSTITADVLAAVLRRATAVVVQDDSGAVWTIARLSAAQAEDPQLVVLLDHDAALALVAASEGSVPAAARRATAELRARGDLL